MRPGNTWSSATRQLGQLLTLRAAMQLALRRLTLDDIAAVHEWASLPESCRYQALSSANPPRP
jgi:hypothetical protein